MKSYPCCCPLSPHLHPLTSTNGRREEEGARTIFNQNITGEGEGGGAVTREGVRGGGSRWSHLLVVLDLDYQLQDIRRVTSSILFWAADSKLC